jgi:ElaB/YqjD/DUF883 family membrane-anchored ribosome-binding protein
MDNETEVIKHQMEETRRDLTEKLETLEHQVVETVTGTTHAVEETVENVKEAVEETVEKVKDSVTSTLETVKNALNLKLQVERHPWPMMAGAVAVGFLGGYLLDRAFGHRGGRGVARDAAGYTGDYSAQAGYQGRYTETRPSEPAYAARPEPSRGGLLSGLTGYLGSEFGKLKALALGALFGLAREKIGRAVPGEFGQKIAEAIDGITRKLGGEILSPEALAQLGVDGAASSPTGREGGPAFR